jgi:uncharacterized protein (DUF305 family)
MSTSASTSVPAEGAEGSRPSTAGWARVAMALAAVLALLLVGAAIGLLIAQSRPSGPATPGPDSVAVGFCQDMTVHHRQAVRMAGIARDRSTDPVVKHIAFDIETSQIEQVGRMQGWLNLWGRDPLPVGGFMGWMAGPSHSGGHPDAMSGPVAQMPGMASEAELARLEQLTGQDLDVLFLQLMLRHHQGGLPMMRYAAEHAEVGVVRNLAAQMVTAQDAEVDLLTHMLTERSASPLPAPS